jgi:hypothetical protein
MEATRGAGFLGVLKETFLVASNLYRLYLTVGAQIMSQWSGAGSITLYAPDLFSLLGITGTDESLLVTAVFGIIKLCAAIACALFLVDVIGRKRSLMIGITLQAVSMIYIASFLTAVPRLGVVDDYQLAANETGPSKGAIAMIYISGVCVFRRPTKSSPPPKAHPLFFSSQVNEYPLTSRTVWLGSGLEFDAVSVDRRTLSPSDQSTLHLDRHVFTFCQPIRQLARCAQHAAADTRRHQSQGHILVLCCGYHPGFLLGVIQRA